MRVTRRDRIEKIIHALEEQMRALKSIGLHDCASLALSYRRKQSPRHWRGWPSDVSCRLGTVFGHFFSISD